MSHRTDPRQTVDTAVAFVSHRICPSVRSRFRDLVAETPDSHDVYFLYDATDGTAEDVRTVRQLAGERLRTFVAPDITNNPYPNPWADPTRKQLLPGNTDLLFLHFAQMEPTYDQYWFIEYDVVYTGSWTTFFQSFDDASADLLGTTLYPYDRRPDWYWWPSFETPFELDRSDWISGFFPLIRVSDELLTHVHEAYLAGWTGHVEAVLPTLANHQGLAIEDIGGDGPYVRSGRRNRFYFNSPEADSLFPGTFIYRPVRARPGRRKNMLWHPIKPNQGLLRSYAQLAKHWIKSDLLNR
jgi:hypothetical protein